MSHQHQDSGVGRRSVLADWLAVASLLMALMLLSARVVLAHEVIVTSSDPPAGATVTKSPAQVTARFSEELDTKACTMRVMDSTGKQVSEGEGAVDLNDADHQTMLADLPTALSEGIYTVQWHAVLTDGDPTDGTFQFAVQPQGTPLLPTVAPITAEPEASSPDEAEAASTSPAEDTPVETQPAGLSGAPILAVLVLAAAAVGLVIVVRRNSH